jgi:hypothetical protein
MAIEDIFFQSWDGREEFYKYLIEEELPPGSFVEPIQKMFIELRKRGYDRKLRLGVDILSLALSPALNPFGHFLPGQPVLSIVSVGNGDDGVKAWYVGADGKAELKLDRPEFTPELEALLTRLIAHPIYLDTY